MDASVGISTWITADLLAETIQTWEGFYGRKLTADDAFEILQNLGLLIDCLESHNGQELPRPSTGIEPRAGA